MDSKYRIVKHSEPFPGFPPDCLYGIEERTPVTDDAMPSHANDPDFEASPAGYFTWITVYEPMLTEGQAKRAVEAEEFMDAHGISDPTDRELFIEESVYTA